MLFILFWQEPSETSLMDVVPPHYCQMGWNCSFSIQPSLAFVGEEGVPYCCWVGVGALAPTRSLLITAPSGRVKDTSLLLPPRALPDSMGGMPQY